MEKAATNNLSRLQPSLRECRDMALTRLTERLGEMFNKSEQALLDFIDKADTNQGQFQFIDAISVVNFRRSAVEQRFLEEIARGFSEYTTEKGISYPRPLLQEQHQAVETLELVDDNELDQRLALQNMIDRTQSQCFQQVYALGQRLSMIRGGQQLAVKDLPGGPVHCVSAFQIAAEEFAFESNILLIIYTLFEKFVMRELEEFYAEYNQILIDAGVFPNLKLEAPKNPAGSEQSDSEAGATEEGESPAATEAPESDGGDIALGEEIFNSIRNLMASRRTGDPRYAKHPEINPHMAGKPGVKPMVDKPTLVSAIHEIQTEETPQLLPEIADPGKRPSTIEVDAAILDQIRQRLIEERDRLFQGVDENTIPSADLDTIELVGMLFEHVLNEDELPNIAKALISHLHTPYLKVAILDHHFLIDSRHIARKLLNLMVESGLKWIEEEDLRRGIYYPMQEGVNRILHEFKDDVKVFEEVFDTLTEQVSDLDQKARIVETRAKEAAKGRERLENARLRAHGIVQDIVGERRFHPVVERFLNHAWLDKMILMLLRDPAIESKPEWGHVLDVVKDIIWIYESKDDVRMQRSLEEKLPGLKQRIDNGLSSVGDLHQPDLQALFEFLTSLIASDDKTATKPEPIQASAPRIRDKRTEAVISATERKDFATLSSEEQEAIKLLKSIKFGTWFELEDDNGKPHRLKLSWFSPITQKYMFVDKSGIQALVTPIEKLAQQMNVGRARIVKYPAVPFVDRALDSVLSVLQKTFGGSGK